MYLSGGTAGKRAGGWHSCKEQHFEYQQQDLGSLPFLEEKRLVKHATKGSKRRGFHKTSSASIGKRQVMEGNPDVSAYSGSINCLASMGNFWN